MSGPQTGPTSGLLSGSPSFSPRAIDLLLQGASTPVLMRHIGHDEPRTENGFSLRLGRGSHRAALNAIVRRHVVLANTLIKQKVLWLPAPVVRSSNRSEQASYRPKSTHGWSDLLNTHDQLPGSGVQGRISTVYCHWRILSVHASLNGQTLGGLFGCAPVDETLPTPFRKISRPHWHSYCSLVALFWESSPQPNSPSSSSPKSGRCWQQTATSATANKPRFCTRTCGWMADPPCSMEALAGRQSSPETRTQASSFRQSATRHLKCLRPEGYRTIRSRCWSDGSRWVHPGRIRRLPAASRPPTGKRTQPPVRATGPGSRCKRTSPPPVRNKTWPADPIDNFILNKLEPEGLNPSSDADRYTLLRRVYFDLIGLPPEPEDIKSFARDDSELALEKVVDRLLRSPGFGERWGRHWLDLTSYADSLGQGRRIPAREAWRYRDYVINAFNSDKPYDRFVQEQVSGDVLPWKTDPPAS